MIHRAIDVCFLCILESSVGDRPGYSDTDGPIKPRNDAQSWSKRFIMHLNFTRQTHLPADPHIYSNTQPPIFPRLEHTHSYPLIISIE